ncbi:hypothetical protein [Pontixanthobacter aquaemixtae]|uniref:Pentapeptide repeat-containing protein n=1 Tax=Pontixanthobacter aquaemixtae TaxID=1958940 RepID=A0A844ZN54_9SPHN|nr:hypothetical protein [Pontixanthobacter aquaemixtae]MXO89811.1 hypothetical protein [Pontixanthobacter aquaemixtae]
MRIANNSLIMGLAALSLAVPRPALSQDIDFGDDSSAWANDGECDDKRFVGPGMTETTLLETDVGRDATDCRTAYEDGKLSLRGDKPGIDSSAIDWGDDESEWANDGECDDRRFAGAGMTATRLLETDLGHDATDCRTAFEAGNLKLRTDTPRPDAASIDWGDDESEWANDGECDDKRFFGPGMTETPLLDADVLHDATDCRSAYEAGDLSISE